MSLICTNFIETIFVFFFFFWISDVWSGNHEAWRHGFHSKHKIATQVGCSSQQQQLHGFGTETNLVLRSCIVVWDWFYWSVLQGNTNNPIDFPIHSENSLGTHNPHLQGTNCHGCWKGQCQEIRSSWHWSLSRLLHWFANQHFSGHPASQHRYLPGDNRICLQWPETQLACPDI